MNVSLPSSQDRRAFWWLMLLALVVLGAGIGQRDPWPSDEPRFTLSAKQMVESGDWLFPHRGRELYSDKPPMLMWLEAGSYEVVRDWRVAFLLPSLLAGLLCIGLTWDLARRLWNPRAGIYAGGALLFAFQFAYQMKRAQIDPLVTAWITLANWGLLLHCLRGPNWRAYWLGCFAAGLGVITKGVGFLALLMLLPYAFARWRNWDGVTRTSHSTLRWLGGIPAFLLPILAWGVPMLLVAHARGTPQYAAYVHDLLFHQTAQRYAESWNHQHPFWYYLPIVTLSWLPLSLGYLGAARPVVDALRKRDARVLLLLAWSLLILLFFSLSSGKRDVYVMPVLPMTAVLIAPWLEPQLARTWMKRLLFGLCLLAGAAFTLAGIAILLRVPAVMRELAFHGVASDAPGLGWMLACIGAGFFVPLAVFRIEKALVALLIGLSVIWLAWGFLAYPLLNDSSSARGVMQQAGAIAGRDGEIALVGWKEQNLLLADRKVEEFGFETSFDRQFADATAWQRQAPQRRWIFALDLAMGDCVDRSRAIHVGRANRREWWMFRADAVIPGCVPAIAANREQTEKDGGAD
ncbi:MAG: glycosyltransferase family 39 protein [Proteobacteria bacterium]|nr:glycosyltransferase family 39 protein [Pseudomonadota bacterium]